jgi:hypothetical protein
MAHYAANPEAGCSEIAVLSWFGHLAIASDASVTTASCKGKGATWSKQGTGLYRLVLDRAYCGVQAGGGSIQLTLVKAAASKFGIELIDEDYPNGTFNFRVIDCDSAGQPAINPTVALGVKVNIRMTNSGNTWG